MVVYVCACAFTLICFRLQQTQEMPNSVLKLVSNITILSNPRKISIDLSSYRWENKSSYSACIYIARNLKSIDKLHRKTFSTFYQNKCCSNQYFFALCANSCAKITVTVIIFNFTDLVNQFLVLFHYLRSGCYFCWRKWIQVIK